MKKIIVPIFSLSLLLISCFSEKENEMSGIVIDAMSENVVMSNGVDTLIFSIAEAQKECPDGIHDGDSITVYYKGEASPTSIVTKVEVKCTEKKKENVIKGVILDATMNNVLVLAKKDTLSFSTMEAEKECPDGILIGDSIYVYYKNTEKNEKHFTANKIIVSSNKDKK